ncbi:hypothetical protein PAXINDRAFT_6434 [Paxillus involutus ATCC 200175]|nr:hypothetical protein PAXINDRAFT_6434 [Paxillus involutus ATCC 200175]
MTNSTTVFTKRDWRNRTSDENKVRGSAKAFGDTGGKGIEGPGHRVRARAGRDLASRGKADSASEDVFEVPLWRQSGWVTSMIGKLHVVGHFLISMTARTMLHGEERREEYGRNLAASMRSVGADAPEVEWTRNLGESVSGGSSL